MKAKIDRGDRFVLIDVREPHEYQICNIPQAKLIPLGDLPKRVNELDSADEIIAHCKSGMRSAKAVDFLKQAGFKKVRNMKGGILAWSDKVDPRSRSIELLQFVDVAVQSPTWADGTVTGSGAFFETPVDQTHRA